MDSSATYSYGYQKPVHTKWWWGEVNTNVARLYIQTTDNVGIQRVQCPTSTATGVYYNQTNNFIPQRTYTVSFNANGGSVSQTNKLVTYTSTYGTLPTPSKADVAMHH